MNAEMLIVFFVAAIFLQLQQNVYGFNENRIVNGSVAPDGEFEFLPKMTMLGQGPGLDKIENAICSSTIISKRHILTAAHCVHMQLPTANATTECPKEKVVEVDGALQLKKFHLDLHNYSIQTKYYFHPSYTRADEMAHDITIVEFPEGTDLKIPPVKLAANYVEKEGHMTDGIPETPAVLQNVTVPMLLKCPMIPILIKGILCSGTLDAWADKGDSGGPLLIKRNEKYYQVGIASLVVKYTEVPGNELKSFAYNIYTRISEYCDWISMITKGEAKCEPLPDAPQTAPLTGNSNFVTLNFLFLFFAIFFFA
uniref:Peptidase S1 domain-containing protein n=1 Tax=Panagrolaimus sp. ES5 TaxID=591445 RepID=A0AC34FDT5_9BILA